MDVFSLIVVLEIISVNTYTTLKCSKKRKSVTMLTVCLVTATISALLIPIVPYMPTYGNGNGNGLFMLSGFVFVIPLKILFDQPIKHLIIVMSSSWIYTMFVFVFSYRVGRLFPIEYLKYSVVILETLAFAVTLPYYTKVVNKVFVYILENIDNKLINSLLVISLSWFFIIFLINYTFVEGNSPILEYLIILAVITNAWLSYKMVYKLVIVNNKAKELSRINQIDTLTQLKNRLGFYEETLKRIEKNQSFTMIYMDLDDFKSVNDSFGHAAGDIYLIEFVNTVKNSMDINEGFYRLHGDEFVLLIDELEVDTFFREIDRLELNNNSYGLSFKGISSGYASFPTDGNDISELLYVADYRMYQRKNEKKTNGMLTNTL